MREEFSFEDLINPVSWTRFVQEYHEKKPLLVKRQDREYFTRILTMDRINDHLGSADLIYPGVRLVKDANEVSPAQYTYTVTTTPRKSTEGVVDKEKLFSYLFAGYTVILNSHERHSREVLHLRHLAEKTFGAKAQANIYITPRGSQGFTPHWDTHDVFILQIAGSKQWRIYDSPITLPSKNQLFDGNWDPTLPSLTATLEAGELLYIPRGYVHDATAEHDQLSIHITLGIKAYTYGDLLRILLGRLDEEFFFRRSISISTSVDTSSLSEAVADYITPERVDAAMKEIHGFFLGDRPADVADRLRDYLAVDRLTLATELSRRQSTYYEIATENGQVVVRFNNKAVRLPAFVRPSIEFITSNPRFQVGDIAGALDDQGKMVLCRKLVEEGFLTISG